MSVRREKIKYISIQYKLQLSDILNFKRGQDPELDDTFLEEVNEFYSKQFQMLKDDLSQYQVLDELDFDYHKIKHNTCVLIGRNITWNLSQIFEKLGFDNRNKVIELKDFRYCQANLLKKNQKSFNNFELRLVKQIDSQHPKASQKYGEFLLCHFLSRDQLKGCQRMFKLNQKTESIQNKIVNQHTANINQHSGDINQNYGQNKPLVNNHNNLDLKKFMYNQPEQQKQNLSLVDKKDNQQQLNQNEIKKEKDSLETGLQVQQENDYQQIQSDQVSSTMNLYDYEHFQNKEISPAQNNIQNSSIQEQQVVQQVPQLLTGLVEVGQLINNNQERLQTNDQQNNNNNNNINQSHGTSSNRRIPICKQEHDQQPNTDSEKQIQQLKKQVLDLQFQLNKQRIEAAKEQMRMFYLQNPNYEYEPTKKLQKESIKQEIVDID
ncbi:hypothetical protein ABPG74_018189 [Tetrahymena malaccensis]